jgi:hypothetical protein
MNDAPRASEADRRLDQHLELLRSEPPEPGTALVPRVVRTARLQRMLRTPAKAVIRLASTVAGGVAALLGARSRR